MALTLTAQPALLQAAYNPILLTLTDSTPTLGQSYYVQVAILNTNDVATDPSLVETVVATLVRPGIDGPDVSATFDVSGVVRAQLPLPQLTSSNSRDSRAYVGYRCHYGTVSYESDGSQTLTQAGSTGPVWALRAALPLSGIGQMNGIYATCGTPVLSGTTPPVAAKLPAFLTNAPELFEVDRNSMVLLPVFYGRNNSTGVPAQRLYLRGTFDFSDGTQLALRGNPVSVGFGGVYLLDASPTSFFLSDGQRDRLIRYQLTAYVNIGNDDDDDGQSDNLYADVPVAGPRTFTLRTAPLFQPQHVHFINRKGGWDSLTCTRSREGLLKTKPVLYDTVSGQRVLQVTAETEETIFSPWLPASHEPWLRDLLLSPYVTVNGAYVKLTSTTLDRSNDDDLVSLTLTYQPLYEENSIKL